MYVRAGRPAFARPCVGIHICVCVCVCVCVYVCVCVIKISEKMDKLDTYKGFNNSDISFFTPRIFLRYFIYFLIYLNVSK